MLVSVKENSRSKGRNFDLISLSNLLFLLFVKGHRQAGEALIFIYDF